MGARSGNNYLSSLKSWARKSGSLALAPVTLLLSGVR